MPSANRCAKPGHIGNALASSFYALVTVGAVSLAGAEAFPATAGERPAVLPTTSVADLLAVRDTWGKSPSAVKQDDRSASGRAGYAVLPTTSVADLVAMREAWGTGQRSAVEAPAAQAPRAAVGYPKLPTTSVADLFAMREAWGSAPSSESSQTSGLAVLPTTSVADLVKMREAWGPGKASQPAKVRLAAGAVSPLPRREQKIAEGPKGEPVVHALTATPPAVVAALPQGETERALVALLAERASWGVAPSLSIGAPRLAAFAVLPTTNVSDLVRMRESWGLGGNLRSVKSPLAAGAVSPLPKAKLATALASKRSAEPIVHAAAPSPAASLTPVAPAELDTALAGLLAERASWGKAPSVRVAAAGPMTEAAPDAAREDNASCETRLRQAAMSGAILFETSSAAIDASSNATLDALAGVVRSCGASRILIEGHTDSSGRLRTNRQLSARRAAAVAEYLRKAGVEKGRLVAVGMGQAQPIAPNDTAEGRARNRRIEFRIVE